MFLPSKLTALPLACLYIGASSFPTWPSSSSQKPILLPQEHSQDYKFDALLHLPGISPYFDAVGFGLKHKAPEGCRVTAASYLIRHSAIYCNDDEYEEFIKPFLKKLDKNRKGWSGPLEFMSKWKSPIEEGKLEDITPSGLSKSCATCIISLLTCHVSRGCLQCR